MKIRSIKNISNFRKYFKLFRVEFLGDKFSFLHILRIVPRDIALALILKEPYLWVRKVGILR